MAKVLNTIAPDKKLNLFLCVAALFFAGFIVYAGSIPGKFIWDDDFLVVNNEFIKSPTLANVENIVSHDVGGGARLAHRPYRPVQILSYMWDHLLWGSDSSGYHVTNIILHCLAAAALMLFLITAFGDHRLAFLTALLFVVHPVNTNAVSYISGRSDPLGAIFIFLSFTYYLKALKENKTLHLVLFTIFYFLAVNSREYSLFLPVFILIYHYAFRVKIQAKYLIPYAVIFCLFLMIRAAVFQGMHMEAPATTTLLERIPGFFRALAMYARILILPVDLRAYYGKAIYPVLGFPQTAGLLILFGLLWLVFRSKKTERIYIFCAAWFLAGILPQSNLYPINAYMAEHWLYIPAVGFYLSLAFFLSRGMLLKRKILRTVSFLAAGSLMIYYSAFTIHQQKYWLQPIAFYERTIGFADDNAYLVMNLAGEYKRAGDYKMAIKYYTMADKLMPRDPKILCNLGAAYTDDGDLKQAAVYYNMAAEIDPGYALCYNNMAINYYKMGDINSAKAACDRAVSLGYPVQDELLSLINPGSK